ncbi:AlbA family DNA-binding domain-containing protein [Natronoflexus pectinivorans]|uniref:Putative DNA-binding protein n=1 Tax=Natronoflexus pectinivorans TaxID=682526 RepID=A0A4R2GLT6_9BACT|nr:ATP-binding protein [Natronoflexus pectinivorans]TCO09700.1 putative DNA-binding protein [Natronoflexus pectinivorans]
MKKKLRDIIAEGEHQTQDFKYAITDSKKIARSLAAFANTDGGSLLVGVKDNGRIAGVASDEEYYMVEAAANMYCKPPVSFETKIWEEDSKTVLEVIVPKSSKKPHKAPTKDGDYKVYVRVNDQNILANGVLLKVWARQKRKTGTFLKLTQAENTLLKYFETNESISLPGFQKIAGINRWSAEKIIINLLVMNILEMDISEKQCLYRLKKK